MGSRVEHRGLTFIEVMFYIAFTSLMLTSALLAFYQASESAARSNDDMVTGTEGTFAIRKLGALLSNASSVLVPSAGTATSLSLLDSEGRRIDVRRVDERVEMRRGTGSYVPLTTVNVSVTDFTVRRLPGPGIGVEIRLTIDGEKFGISRYIEL